LKDFSERLVRIRPAAVYTFICPLCERSFTRDALAGTKPQVTLVHVLHDPSWPSLGPRGPVKGAIVRFRTDKDTGTRVVLREVWNLLQKMP
jgi:hypothetical protein